MNQENGRNAFDAIRLNSGVIGMVLPNGDIITFERRNGRGVVHEKVPAPKIGEFTAVSQNDLTDEKRTAFNFARQAFEMYFPVHR